MRRALRVESSEDELRPCLESGCGRLVDRGRCDVHEAFETLLRAIYTDPRWQTSRTRCFTRDYYRCDCGHEDVSHTGKGLHAHHEPRLRDLLLHHLDPFDHNYLRTKCDSCHSIATAEERAAG